MTSGLLLAKIEPHFVIFRFIQLKPSSDKTRLIDKQTRFAMLLCQAGVVIEDSIFYLLRWVTWHFESYYVNVDFIKLIF